jgi:hypothetical protein
MNKCCKLDEEFICGIVRNRSGIDFGQLICVRTERVEKDLESAIKEVEYLLKTLKSYKLKV